MSKVAPESLFPPCFREPRVYTNTSTTTVPLCPVCTEVLDQPLQLECGSILCLNCVRNWILSHPHSCPPCPCCYNTTQLDTTHIMPPPPLVMSVLEGILIYCGTGCGKVVRLGEYKDHLNEKCKTHYCIDSPTIDEVLSRPITTPATPAEMRVAEHLVKKIIDSSESKDIIQIPRRGNVSAQH